MSDRRDVIYVYDGTFDGFLSAVHAAFYRHEDPLEMAADGDNVQQQLFCDIYHVCTDQVKSAKVYAAVGSKISPRSRYNTFCAFLSDLPDKETLLLQYLRLGFKLGKNTDSYLTSDIIRRVNDTAKRVSNEAHLHKEFLRFSELSNGALYAEISPVCDVLPLIMGHFRDRLPCIPWMINDLTHGQCALYNGKECDIRYVDSAPVLRYSDEEIKYRRLWKMFYDTVEIKPRHNEKCRMSHMPKRYWQHMTEFLPDNA